MRRVVPIGLLTGLAFAALAVPANAFDHHFTVIGKQTSSHNDKNSFRFTDELVAPFDHSLRVGRDKGECVFVKPKIQCRVTVHLNGKLGGFGDMHVKGNLGRHDNGLNVVSGTRGFDGVAGKVLVGNHNHLHFDIVR
jgi:hypothetical protein